MKGGSKWECWVENDASTLMYDQELSEIVHKWLYDNGKGLKANVHYVYPSKMEGSQVMGEKNVNELKC